MSYILHDNGVNQEFDTEENVLAASALAIEDYLDRDTGWSYEVNYLHVSHDGVKTHGVVEVPDPFPVEEQDAMDDDQDYRPPFDFYCHYEMRPVARLPERVSTLVDLLMGVK